MICHCLDLADLAGIYERMFKSLNPTQLDTDRENHSFFQEKNCSNNKDEKVGIKT